MATIVTRAGKGSPLTNSEVDANFTNLNNDKLEKNGGTLAAALGTVTAPSIAFSGDANTGLWSPAADTVAVSTGGSERVRVTSAGSLGLGWPVTDGFWGSQVSTAARQVITYSASGTSINTAGKGLVVVNNDLTAGNLSSLVFGTWNTDATPIAVASVYSVNTDVRANTFTTGALAFATVASGGVLTERMRLDAAGNLGLGVTPSAWNLGYRAVQVSPLTSVVGAAGFAFVGLNWFINAGGVNTYIANGHATLYQQNAGAHAWLTAASGTAGTAITFTQAMTLDASGNLGVGVTPSAWGGQFGSGTLELRNGSALYAYNGAIQVGLSNNCFFNGTNWIYKNSGFALRYQQTGAAGFGTHEWLVAGSGTQNAQVTFTQAMTLDASGRLGIGTTSPGSRLHVSDVSNSVLAGFHGAGDLAFRLAIRAYTDTIGTETFRLALEYNGNATNGFVSFYRGANANGGFLAFSANGTERVRVKPGGQVRFVPLAAAPTDSVEDGDVYYNSGTNKLQVRAGGVWVDLH